jgi:hypothetical protein
MIVDIILRNIVMLLVNVFLNQEVVFTYPHQVMMMMNNGVHMDDISNRCILSKYCYSKRQKQMKGRILINEKRKKERNLIQ